MEPVNDNGVATEELNLPNEGRTELPQGETSPAESQLAQLTDECSRLTKEKAELQDLLQRRQAEFENYRRRMERERADLFEFAAMDAVKALLPILDDFERALKVDTADKEYARGMELIYRRLSDSLKKLGLERMSTEVPLFNPHIHDAVQVVDTKDYPDQTILEEFEPGYYFKGRLLRTAKVKVANNQ